MNDADVRDVVVIGTGFAGLAMAIRLKQSGIDDFVVLERAPSLGGTWRDNTYPGAACDIHSHLYSFSFEPWPEWSRMFGQQREILAYMEHCADKYGLRPHLRFNAGVKRATFDEARGTWTLETSDGKTLRARVVVAGTGPLNRPAFPAIEGRDAFRGDAFHSMEWDHDVRLEGKRVAVIGTGASAIQIIPEIAPNVRELQVYQRTPPWIMPKPDRPIDGWEQSLFRRVPAAQQIARTAIYWSLEWRAALFTMRPDLLERAKPMALRYLRARVKDAGLREKLTPSYTIGCKRVLMSNDYFETLQRPNVELVTDRIASIGERSIATADGKERPVDVVVYATGFRAAEDITPFEIHGRGGLDLNDAWRDGAEAYLGTSVAGFPNLFLIIGPNTGLGHNSMVFMIESQVRYVLDAIRKKRARRWKIVDVRRDAQARYNRRLQARMASTVWSTGGCSSWYVTADGKNTTLWPGFTVEFRLRTRRFDESVYECIAEDERSAAAIRPRPIAEAAE